MSLIPNINNQALQLLPDIALWKQQIADAINYKGGEADPNEAFTELAEDIKEIPNFNTNGCEYISDISKPTTLLDAYYNRTYLKSVVDNDIEEILVSYTFTNCAYLNSVQMPNLVTINGSSTFTNCAYLNSVQMPKLVRINNSNTFSACNSLKIIELPSLVTINGDGIFSACNLLERVECPKLTNYPSNFLRNSQPLNITLGVLIEISTTQYTKLTRTINITIGQGTDVDLPFNFWTAINVIAEGQSGIDELNSNLYNNLLTKLYDHSQDGQTRTLRIGWLANVSEDNIAYATAKGWTLTT